MPDHQRTKNPGIPGRRGSRAVAALLSAAMLLGACEATLPVTGDRGVTPQQVTAAPESYRSHRIQWGGVIVDSRNLPHATEIELIAYPLDYSGRPDTTAAPRGRFIAIKSGYLETVDYAKGRLATLDGIVSDLRDGKVGDADYRFPMVEIGQIRLWPQYSGWERRPQIHFGIGIGSGGYSGGSIGIGF